MLSILDPLRPPILLLLSVRLSIELMEPSRLSRTLSLPIRNLSLTFSLLTNRYVPNLGTNNQGILISIGGATDTQYVDNAVLDVYDIGAEGWTKQSTLGDTIGARVNHCAVRGTAVVNGMETHHM